MQAVHSGLPARLLSCVLTLLSAYSFWYADNPLLRLGYSLVLLVSAEIMVMQWGTFFLQTIVDSVCNSIRSRKCPVSWSDRPEFEVYRSMAKKMGVKLHKKRPFGTKPGLDNAYADGNSRQIVLGTELLVRLKEPERRALVAHELAHLKGNHSSKTMMVTLLVSLIAAQPLLMTGAPPIIVELAAGATFTLAFVIVSHRHELDADAVAATLTGKTAVISLLKGLVPRERWRRESETHPPVLVRISRLRRL